MAKKNFYLILGVATDATQDEIQRAYRRSAKVLHPDYYGHDSKPFLDLQEAYAVLSDPAQRRAYDRRQEGSRPRPTTGRVTAQPVRPRSRQPEPLLPEEEPVHLDDLSLRRSFQTFGPSFEELFDRLWRNFTPARPEMEPLYSLNVEIVLAPHEALRGGRVRLLVPAQAPCPVCHGRGGVGWFECGRCRGAGLVVSEVPVLLAFPPGILNNHVVRMPLDKMGIDNFYLNIVFRVSG